jgi:MoaA/NifB/PqqE/SkfB family radical SAM enzyme
MKRPNYIESVKEDRPRTIYFYATSHCNSNCAYCAFRFTNKEMPRVHMPLETIKKVWSNSEILKVCGVVVQGGEFTVHPEAYGIMKFFGNYVPKLTLLTNGIDPFLTTTLLPFSTQVTISVDGPLHDKTRGVKGNLSNIFTLLESMDEYRGGKTLQITLGPWNAKTIEQGTENVLWFLKMCKEFGCQPRFNIASDDGLLGIAHYEQSISVLSEIASMMEDLAKQSEYAVLAKSMKGGAVYIRAALAKKNGLFIPCVSTSIYSTIGADGSVWMCQGLNEHEAVVGNINEKSFDQIWRDSAEKRKQYRECQQCTLSCQLTGDLAYQNSLTSVTS